MENLSNYMLVDSGKCTDIPGGTYVETAEECTTAVANVTGTEYEVTSINNAQNPAGCFYLPNNMTTSRVYSNPPDIDGLDCSERKKCVCKVPRGTVARYPE